MSAATINQMAPPHVPEVVLAATPAVEPDTIQLDIEIPAIEPATAIDKCLSQNRQPRLQSNQYH